MSICMNCIDMFFHCNSITWQLILDNNIFTELSKSPQIPAGTNVNSLRCPSSSTQTSSRPVYNNDVRASTVSHKGAGTLQVSFHSLSSTAHGPGRVSLLRAMESNNRVLAVTYRPAVLSLPRTVEPDGIWGGK